MTEQQRTFLDLPPELSDPATAEVVVVPVPYDATSTWMKGADRGPAAIIEASSALEELDIQTGTEPCRRGIAIAPAVEFAGPPERLADEVQAAVARVFEHKQFPVVLGGEHSVSIGAIRAAAHAHRDLSILQIDAHADLRDSYRGSNHNHACVMARAREVGPIVQVGIRAIDRIEAPLMEPERTFYAHEIAGDRDRRWVDAAVQMLTEHVYVTIDVDGLDPSLIPATGTPEPGGLSWYDLDALLEAVARNRRVVGFDVVELLPMPGHHASAFVAAKIVYRFLAEILLRR